MKTKILKTASLAAMLILFSTITCNAAAKTASVSGSWSNTATWGGTAVPTSADDVTINPGISVNIDVANAQCASLTFAPVSANSALTISGTNSLSITGLLSMPRPSTGFTCTVNVNAGTLTCGSLTMGATTVGRNDNINITTGTLTISGTLTTGTTGCIITFTNTGTINIGLLSGSPTITTVTGCSVNYTGTSAQTIYAITYNGNLGLSGTGTKTMATAITVNGNLTIDNGTPLIVNASIIININGNINNSGSITITAGTNTTNTWWEMAGNLTNNAGATITATGNYTRFIFISSNAQTFTNNGTVTSPVASFDVANSHASGLTLSGSNNIVANRVNLFYGSIINSNQLTLGNGGASSVIVQRGMVGTTLPAGSFDTSPTFNVGTGGLSILYDNGSAGYNTGYEIPASHTADYIALYDAADVSLNNDLTISSNLTFAGGTGTAAFRIGANTLTLNGTITYTAIPNFYGGTSSNMILNGATIVKAITNGLNNLTINGNTTLGGAITVNGTFSLSSGILINGTYLTMANGSTIIRSQGSVWTSPTFAGNVNLVYSGSSSITTGAEAPVSTSVLNNLTTNTGGVIQGGTQGIRANILTDAFGTISSWIGNKGTSGNQFMANSSSNAGGTANECRYTYGSSPSTIYTASIYRSVNTSGYSSINIRWKQFLANYDPITYPYTIKVQCASSSSGPWTDIYSLSPSNSDNIGSETKIYNNWTTNVGGTFFIRYYITGYTYGMDYWYIDDLVIEGPVPLTTSTITINGTLDLTNGTYSIASNTLALNGEISGTNAIIGSSTSNLSVGGSGSNLFIPVINNGLKNFTINRSNGVTLNTDLSVEGILNLQSSNPSAVKGSLDIGTNTLTMGGYATTTGTGDVTGIVKRTSFVANTVYSFGNQFTTMTIAAGGTMPTDISFKIGIGSAPSWKSSAVQRTYDIIRTGGSGTTVTLSLHYLDNELQLNTESNIIIWDYHSDIPKVEEHGKANQSTVNNWIAISNRNITYFSTTFNDHLWGISDKESVSFVWQGSASSNWNDINNWSSGTIPGLTNDVVIPDASTTLNDPVLPSSPSASVKTILIQSGGILEGGTATTITVGGSTGSWINMGTFNAGTSTVIFTHANATISGTSNFYNVTTNSGSGLTPETDNIMRISGALLNNGILRAALLPNTIEFNGAGQVIINPNGTTPGYNNLILSGSGTKTMPSTNIDIYGNFNLSGTVDCMAASSINIKGNLTIGAGTAFQTGLYNHYIQGNLIIDGAFTANSGSTITMNSNSTAQMIEGLSGSITFNNLEINNTFSSGSLTLGLPINISNSLILTNKNIITSETNTLHMLAGSSVSPEGGSASSFIDGPISKTGTTAFVFPVGNGNHWARIGIGIPSGSTTFTAQYFAVPNTTPSTMAASPLPVLESISTKEYWNLERTSGSGNATITLYWEDASWSLINDCSNNYLRIAHWNSTDSTWENNNDVVTTSGSCTGSSSGSITINTVVTSFSPFTFGSISSAYEPLPVELITFTAKDENKNVALNWSTLSETNNAFFTVEKSLNGIEFIQIAKIDGKGNSNIKNDYSALDTNPINGINYYRLRQTDFDEKSSFSKIISFNFSEINFKNASITVFPNPINNNETTTVKLADFEPEKEAIVVVCNVLGEEMFSKSVITDFSGNSVIAIDIENRLSKGTYLIIGKSSNQILKKYLIVR